MEVHTYSIVDYNQSHMKAGLLSIVTIILVALAAWIIFVRPPVTVPVFDELTATFTAPCNYRAFPILPLDTPVPPPGRIPPDGLSRYRNEKFRFSLFYPSDLKVQEVPEIGGATTIVFQDSSSLAGFQIFVVPYKNPGIVTRRIAKDVPGGNALERATSTVAGVCATSFTTSDPVASSTTEVWIPKDGYLFEVTTYTGQEDLLNSVIDSWRFL